MYLKYETVVMILSV